MTIESKQLIQYFPPGTRRAMLNALVDLSDQEIALAKQVEETLASNGTIVPGSLFDTPQKNRLISKILGVLKK